MSQRRQVFCRQIGQRSLAARAMWYALAIRALVYRADADDACLTKRHLPSSPAFRLANSLTELHCVVDVWVLPRGHEAFQAASRSDKFQQEGGSPLCVCCKGTHSMIGSIQTDKFTHEIPPRCCLCVCVCVHTRLALCVLSLQLCMRSLFTSSAASCGLYWVRV